MLSLDAADEICFLVLKEINLVEGLTAPFPPKKEKIKKIVSVCLSLFV